MNIQEERTIKPTIVVTGCQRSGTTLVRSILAQHPDLSVHPSEPQFILELWKRYGPVIDDVPAAIDYVNLHRYKAESISLGRLQPFFRLRTSPCCCEISSTPICRPGAETICAISRLSLKTQPLSISSIPSTSYLPIPSPST
ncbi:MAG: sulfotransferase [Chloroflexi bacterium]|nr:sulfotransferase [Chloroflexota bacterium]